MLYENKYGIKCFNQLVSSDLFEYFGPEVVFELSCDQINIAFDGLNDQYTLLNTCILNSPHFDLVKHLEDNGDLRSCLYIEKVQKGILDFRASKKINSNYLINLKSKFEQKKTDILNNRYDPVKTIKIFDKYYIADGKHTAATCALLNVPVKCTDYSMFVLDSFFWWIYRKMLKNKKIYRIHIDYFESILDYFGKKKEEIHAIQNS